LIKAGTLVLIISVLLDYLKIMTVWVCLICVKWCLVIMLAILKRVPFFKYFTEVFIADFLEAQAAP